MILNDLAKYSATRSVARSLCDSWFPCSTVRREPNQLSKTGVCAAGPTPGWIRC